MNIGIYRNIQQAKGPTHVCLSVCLSVSHRMGDVYGILAGVIYFPQADIFSISSFITFKARFDIDCLSCLFDITSPSTFVIASYLIWSFTIKVMLILGVVTDIWHQASCPTGTHYTVTQCSLPLLVVLLVFNTYCSGDLVCVPNGALVKSGQK